MITPRIAISAAIAKPAYITMFVESEVFGVIGVCGLGLSFVTGVSGARLIVSVPSA